MRIDLTPSTTPQLDRSGGSAAATRTFRHDYHRTARAAPMWRTYRPEATRYSN